MSVVRIAFTVTATAVFGDACAQAAFLTTPVKTTGKDISAKEPFQEPIV